MPDEQGTGVIKWAATSDDLIEMIEHELKGEELVENKTTYKDALGNDSEDVSYAWKKSDKLDTALTEEGIKKIGRKLRTFLTRNVYLSNFSEEQTNKLAKDILLCINSELFYNAKQWRLKPEDYNSLITDMQALVIPSLRRPLGEGERKFYKTTTQELIQSVQSAKQSLANAATNLFGNQK